MINQNSFTPPVGDERLPEWFWQLVTVDPDTECWEWGGPKTPDGYGFPYLPERKAKAYSHRWAYETLVGPIFEGGHIDHLCRNRGCCNPAHLEPVTPQENTLRSPVAVAAINSRKTHCIQGHEFTDENTAVSKNGSRSCRTCARERAAERMRDPEYAKKRRDQVAASNRRYNERKRLAGES